MIFNQLFSIPLLAASSVSKVYLMYSEYKVSNWVFNFDSVTMSSMDIRDTLVLLRYNFQIL